MLAASVAPAGQGGTGELRLRITDATGLPVAAIVELISESNQFHQRFQTDRAGRAIASPLPDGVYRVDVQLQGFAPYATLVDIRSAVPRELTITLQVAPLQATVTVTTNRTLVDPHQTSTVARIGLDTLEARPTPLPGRSLLELVSTQPGWVLEANGTLHPRGSEYQTQYLVDGVPLTDNRSPAFLPDLDADNVQSLRVMTASYPAEYGRKLGGVVDVVTKTPADEGFHGSATAYGGTQGMIGGSIAGGYRWTRHAVAASGDAGRTDRFLDPPVVENYTNTGRTAGVFVQEQTSVTDRDRVGALVRRDAATFLVPNEYVQQAAGQRQERRNHETAVQLSYQRVLSSRMVADLRGMMRDVSAELSSNPESTPVVAAQARGYRDQYVKGTVSFHAGIHDLKVGAEGDFATIREQFDSRVTDAGAFETDTPAEFHFVDRALDREQAAFAQDLVRVDNWTFSGGLRWDRYRVLVTERAWSPRAGVAYYWPSADVVVRASYDRVFQTPAFENLLVASSPQVEQLGHDVLRLPVRPSRAHFFEAGVTWSLFGELRVDVNVYRRAFTNYADDELLLNTGVAFPISFRAASIHGAEARIDVPHWGRMAGSFSYSYLKGVGELPVTGGVFLGDEALRALKNTSGSFPITQDQRHTISTRWRYQLATSAWLGVGGAFASGLPTEVSGTAEEALVLYGRGVVDRVDFDAGRVRPSFSLDASASVMLRKTAHQTLRLQIDAINVMDRSNVINFAGVFSGTAIGSPRRVVVRLRAEL